MIFRQNWVEINLNEKLQNVTRFSLYSAFNHPVAKKLPQLVVRPYYIYIKMYMYTHTSFHIIEFLYMKNKYNIVNGMRKKGDAAANAL